MHEIRLLLSNLFKFNGLKYVMFKNCGRYSIDFYKIKNLQRSKNFTVNINTKKSLKYSVLWLAFFPFFQSKKEIKETPENLMARAVFAIENNNLDESLSFLNRILVLLENQFKADEITFLEYEGKKARIYSEMANVHMLKRDINKAADIIIETIRSCFNANMLPSNPTVIELSLKLALIYAELKKYPDSDIGFKFCIENCKLVIEKKESDEEESKNLEALLGVIYNYYSKFLYQTGKFNDALVIVLKAIDQAMKIYDKNHPNVINLFNDQAVIYLAMKDYEQAKLKFQEAIDLCLFCPKDDVISILSLIYANFGHLFIELGDIKNAEEMCVNSRRYYKDISQRNLFNTSVINQIDDCFYKLAGLKSIDRED